MVLNNYQAMEKIREVKNIPLTPELIFEIHRIITNGVLDDPSAAGRLRRENESVVVADEYGEKLHRPPPASSLPRRMDQMCEFANQRGGKIFVHPVIRSMILHFWLAYDHPFVDGNGRTARAIFYWSMLRHGYWLFDFVSISSIILEAPVKYGRAFLETETDENDLTYFLTHHCELMMKAIDRLFEFVQKKSLEASEAASLIRGEQNLNSRQAQVIAHALRNPGHCYTIDHHRLSHRVAYDTARTDLKRLAELGLLIERKQGKALTFYPIPNLGEKLKRRDA